MMVTVKNFDEVYNTLKAKAKKDNELKTLSNCIMDLRDESIRVQRKIAMIEDIAEYEPWKMSAEMCDELLCLEDRLNLIKHRRKHYENIRAMLLNGEV